MAFVQVVHTMLGMVARHRDIIADGLEQYLGLSRSTALVQFDGQGQLSKSVAPLAWEPRRGRTRLVDSYFFTELTMPPQHGEKRLDPRDQRFFAHVSMYRMRWRRR